MTRPDLDAILPPVSTEDESIVDALLAKAREGVGKRPIGSRPSLDAIHFGHAGHFCGSAYCRFHLHTHVGPYCVSTVGDYWPRPSYKQEPIGYQRTYETMVFRILPDGETSAESIDFAAYNSPEAADRGHARLVRKWTNVAKRRAKP